MAEENELKRFEEAQEADEKFVVEELENSHKRSHWMWYMFPQMRGLGMTSTAYYYGIDSLDEACSYLKNEGLAERLLKLSNILLGLEENNPVVIFGGIDSLKLRSSMTLFERAAKEIGEEEKFAAFGKVLDKYYDGERDELTYQILKEQEEDKAEEE